MNSSIAPASTLSNAKSVVIQLPNNNPHFSHLPYAKNNKLVPKLITSMGKPKPQAAEPIRTTEEIKQIQNYFLKKESYRDYALFTVGISIGLRISDLLSLRLSDFINADGTYRNKIDILEKKTGKRSTTASDDCLITPTIQNAITLYLDTLETYELDEYLFKSQKGNNNPLTKESAHRILKQMSRELKLPYNVGTHTLRKTFAYWTIQTNKNDSEALISLQKMFKHDSQQTTLCYAGITKDKTREMRNKLSDLFG